MAENFTVLEETWAIHVDGQGYINDHGHIVTGSEAFMRSLCISEKYKPVQLFLCVKEGVDLSQ